MSVLLATMLPGKRDQENPAGPGMAAADIGAHPPRLLADAVLDEVIGARMRRRIEWRRRRWRSPASVVRQRLKARDRFLSRRGESLGRRQDVTRRGSVGVEIRPCGHRCCHRRRCALDRAATPHRHRTRRRPPNWPRRRRPPHAPTATTCPTARAASGSWEPAIASEHELAGTNAVESVATPARVSR